MSPFAIFLCVFVSAALNAATASIIYRVHDAIIDFNEGVLPGFVDMYAGSTGIVIGLGPGETTLPVYLKPESAQIDTVPHLSKSPILISQTVSVRPDDENVVVFLAGSAKYKEFPLAPRYIKYRPDMPGNSSRCTFRVAHLVPGAAPVTIFSGTQAVFYNLSYGNLSVPISLPLGPHELSLKVAGMPDRSISLGPYDCVNPGQDYIFVAELNRLGNVYGVALPTFAS